MDDQQVHGKFNAGMYQMTRLDRLQSRMNDANLNLLAFDQQLGIFNYQILISSLDSLLQEVLPKLSKKKKVKDKDKEYFVDGDKEKGEKIRDAIRNFLRKHPIHSTKSTPSGNRRSYIEFDEKAWNVIHPMIIEYDSLVRTFLNTHNLNNPPEDDEGMF